MENNCADILKYSFYIDSLIKVKEDDYEKQSKTNTVNCHDSVHGVYDDSSDCLWSRR